MADLDDIDLSELEVSAAAGSDVVGEAAREQLKAFISRIEKLNGEISELQAHRKDIYAESKAMGYDPAVIKKVISRRARDKRELEEEEALLDLYESAIGER